MELQDYCPTKVIAQPRLQINKDQPISQQPKIGKSRQVSFPTAQQVNLTAYSPHCSYNVERQAGML